METTGFKTVSSQDLSNSLSGAEASRFPKGRVWARELYAYSSEKLLPAVKGAYRDNKTWCHRLGGVAVGVGVYTGMISLPMFCYAGVGFVAGTLYNRGSTKESCTKEDIDIVRLIKLLDDLLLDLLSLSSFADDLVKQEAKAPYPKKVHNQASAAQGSPDAINSTEFCNSRKDMKRRFVLELLHCLSTISYAGENIDEVKSQMLKGGHNDEWTKIDRTNKTDYQEIANYVLGSVRGSSHGEEGEPEKVRVKILHAITASWKIPGEDKACELYDKIVAAANVVDQFAKGRKPKAHKGSTNTENNATKRNSGLLLIAEGNNTKTNSAEKQGESYLHKLEANGDRSRKPRITIDADKR